MYLFAIKLLSGMMYYVSYIFTWTLKFAVLTEMNISVETQTTGRSSFSKRLPPVHKNAVGGERVLSWLKVVLNK